MSAGACFHILIVEDNDDDRVLLELALRRASLRAAVSFARSAREAQEYLEGVGVFADRIRFPLPQLVLVDVNLGGADGFGLVAWLRAHETLKGMPAIIMSSAEAEADVTRATEVGAN